MGPEERERRGMKGREWIMSDESRFTATNMGQNFIDSMNGAFDNWKPKKRYTMETV